MGRRWVLFERLAGSGYRYCGRRTLEGIVVLALKRPTSIRVFLSALISGVLLCLCCPRRINSFILEIAGGNAWVRSEIALNILWAREGLVEGKWWICHGEEKPSGNRLVCMNALHEQCSNIMIYDWEEIVKKRQSSCVGFQACRRAWSCWWLPDFGFSVSNSRQTSRRSSTVC
jgi:hypothetical protein